LGEELSAVHPLPVLGSDQSYLAQYFTQSALDLDEDVFRRPPAALGMTSIRLKLKLVPSRFLFVIRRHPFESIIGVVVSGSISIVTLVMVGILRNARR
jgi:hypothetical protein